MEGYNFHQITAVAYHLTASSSENIIGDNGKHTTHVVAPPQTPIKSTTKITL